MANSDYKSLAFPMTVGGGPGVVHTVELTITADVETTPVAAVANKQLYFAANSGNKAKHDRFSTVATHLMTYGILVGLASDGDTKVTASFEQSGLHTDSTIGLPGYVTKVQRPNAYELAQTLIGRNDISAVTVKVDGVTQSS